MSKEKNSEQDMQKILEDAKRNSLKIFNMVYTLVCVLPLFTIVILTSTNCFKSGIFTDSAIRNLSITAVFSVIGYLLGFLMIKVVAAKIVAYLIKNEKNKN
ncbi:MAG TPA: hypothetical protein PKY78_09350 [Candidatus Omnitrophota bacterium]|nr:hypothetical protein [Candidatus Omnitrophota bacterium]